VWLVFAAAVTELRELETACGRLLVLGRRVIPLLAHRALQCHNFPHFLLPFGQQCSVVRDQFVPKRVKLARFPVDTLLDP
jgi:hypothetical protein